MQSKRGELVPVAEVVSRLGGPVAAIREASPQALHHFTRFDQVNQLVGASEADPDLGFMARMMALCSLPRTNPGNRLQYKRVNGPYKLVMIAGLTTSSPMATCRDYWLPGCVPKQYAPKAASSSWDLRCPSSWASWAWIPSAALGPASAIR